VLRALKDLEYERTVGKISDEDFLELSARYRSEAKALLQTLDRELAPARARAEAELAERLEQVKAEKSEKPRKKRKKKRQTAQTETERGAPADDPPSASPKIADDEAAGSDDGAPGVPAGDTNGAEDESPRATSASARWFESCKSRNAADARFCKGCGTTLEASG
jgi:hypothetical protein